MSSKNRSVESRPPLPRMNRFARTLTKLTGGILIVVISAVIAGDQVDPNFLSTLLSKTGFVVATCGKVVGARVLFWTLLVVELCTLAGVFWIAFSDHDVEAYRSGSATILSSTKWDADRWFIAKLAIATTSMMAVAIWGSYHLAYGDRALCVSKPMFMSVMDYCYIIGVNGLRALCLLIGCHLIYTRFTRSKARPTSNRKHTSPTEREPNR